MNVLSHFEGQRNVRPVTMRRPGSVTSSGQERNVKLKTLVGQMEMFDQSAAMRSRPTPPLKLTTTSTSFPTAIRPIPPPLHGSLHGDSPYHSLSAMIYWWRSLVLRVSSHEMAPGAGRRSRKMLTVLLANSRTGTFESIETPARLLARMPKN